MLSYLKEQTNVLSKTFNRENNKANEGLQILQELAQRFHQDVDKGTNTQEILEIIKKLSTFCKFLEMMNTSIDSIISATDQKTFSKLSNSQPANLVQSRVKDWIRFDLSTYRPGDKIKILILHMVNSEKNLCFVQDIAKYCSIDFSNCVIGQCELPPVGMVFAINMNTKWLRAIRVDAEPTNTNIRVRLIDRGETLSINSNTSFFSLSSKAQKLPPKGFMCRVEQVNGKQINSLDSISRMITYNANINAICANMLEVDLWSVNDDDKIKMLNDSIVECANGTSKLNKKSELNGTSGIINGTSGMNKDIKSKNPFLDDDDEIDSCVSEPPSPKAPVCLLPPLPPRNILTNVPLKIPVRIIQKCVQTKDVSAEIKTTHKEPKESKEEDYVNGNTKSCVVRNNCETGTHLKWVDTYRENQENLRNHPHFEPQVMQKLKLPSVGDMIDVCPRHFQSFDEAFFHILPSDKRFDELYNTIAELQSQFKPLKYIPRVNDYVLARYSLDNSIYRAQVAQVVDANSVMVNYIDYGNTESVSIEYLFEWDKLCDVIPVQAVCCRIANMRRVCKVSPEKRFEYLANKYADQPCKAEVLDKNEDGLTINLMSSMGIDICDEIIEYYRLNGLSVSIV